MPPKKILVPNPPPPTLPPKLNAEITAALLDDKASVPRLQRTLLDECQKAAWLDNIQARSLQLLREDENLGYHDILPILVQEALGNGGHGKDSTSSGDAKATNVKIPEKAIDEAVKVVQEGLENVVEFEGEEG